MHFQVISLLGELQNLNKVCFLILFFYKDPATVGHPVNLSYNSIPEEFSRNPTIFQASIWSVYRLFDLFIGAESRFFSQTNRFPSIDHGLYGFENF